MSSHLDTWWTKIIRWIRFYSFKLCHQCWRQKIEKKKKILSMTPLVSKVLNKIDLWWGNNNRAIQWWFGVWPDPQAKTAKEMRYKPKYIVKILTISPYSNGKPTSLDPKVGTPNLKKKIRWELIQKRIHSNWEHFCETCQMFIIFIKLYAAKNLQDREFGVNYGLS